MTRNQSKLFCIVNNPYSLFLWIVLPEEHLWETMAMIGSIHWTKVGSLFITRSDSTRLRNTKKSASWDSTTLLLSAPKTTRTEGELYSIRLHKSTIGPEKEQTSLSSAICKMMYIYFHIWKMNLMHRLVLHSCCRSPDLPPQQSISRRSAAAEKYTGYFGAAHAALPLGHGRHPLAANPRRSWEHRTTCYACNVSVYLNEWKVMAT